MLYVNDLGLSLIAVTAVLFVAARYVLIDEPHPERRQSHAYAAIAAGAVMALTGFHMTLTWPLPGQYNIAFGEPLAYFGALLVVGGIALARGADVQPLSWLAAFGGAGALLVSAAIAVYRLTMIPALAAAAFAAVGLAALSFPLRARHRVARVATGVLLLVAGLLFARITAPSVIHHLAPGSYDRWQPRSSAPPAAIKARRT